MYATRKDMNRKERETIERSGVKRYNRCRDGVPAKLSERPKKMKERRSGAMHTDNIESTASCMPGYLSWAPPLSLGPFWVPQLAQL
jgi:hypothetical protein